jgi:hypothetical protein
MRTTALLAAALLSLTGCFGEQVGLKGEEVEKIEAYRSAQARDFTVRFANAKVNPRDADITAIVTVDAINAPLKKLERRSFPIKDWTFTPTKAPEVELSTGSAILKIDGDLQQQGGRTVSVTLVGGLTVRWSDDGSHLFLKPSALAVVPRTKIGLLDFALGDYIRSFAEEKAEVYLHDRIGEIDVPINLMLPVQRQALELDQAFDTGPTDPGAKLHYSLPPATAEVRLKQLYVWPLEGKLVVLAFADVTDVPLSGFGLPIPPPTVDSKPDTFTPAPPLPNQPNPVAPPNQNAKPNPPPNPNPNPNPPSPTPGSNPQPAPGAKP